MVFSYEILTKKSLISTPSKGQGIPWKEKRVKVRSGGKGEAWEGFSYGKGSAAAHHSCDLLVEIWPVTILSRSGSGLTGLWLYLKVYYIINNWWNRERLIWNFIYVVIIVLWDWWGNTCATVHIWRSDDNLVKLFPPPLMWAPGLGFTAPGLHNKR